MKAEHTLQVTRREKTGSRYAQRDRDRGRLPAVLYGQAREPVALNLDAKEALRFFELGEKVFNIELKDESVSQTVLLKDLQYDYLGTNVVHVDLERVDLGQEIESNVPIHFVGEAKGAGASGAILTHPVTSLTVRCAVRDLPEAIDADISDLGVGDALSAGAIELPSGVVLIDDPETIVAAVEIAAAEEAAEAGGGEGEAGAPEVITEKKKEESGG